MRSVRRGSVLLFVMLAAAAITIWTSVMIHRARYTVQAATDRLAWEQRLAAAEAVLSYAVAWCQENRALVAPPREKMDEKKVQEQEGEQEQVEQEPPPASSWELIFERLPLSDRHACRAQVALSRHETDGIRLSATLSDGRARLFALQAVVTGFANDDGSLTLSGWHEGTAI